MALPGDPSDVEPPAQVYLHEPETPWKPTVEEPFARTQMDARETANFTTKRVTGLAMPTTGDETPLALAFTVAHEFTHKAQYRGASPAGAYNGAPTSSAGSTSPSASTGGSTTGPSTTTHRRRPRN
jgi:hypothetical protein